MSPFKTLNIFKKQNRDINIPINGSNILIVDNNVKNTKLLLKAIDSPLLNIKVCMNPESAILAAKQTKFDLCIININLNSSKSGLALAQNIKSEILNADTPIMFISPASDMKSKIQCYHISSCAHIETPININIAKAQILSTLNSKYLTNSINSDKESFLAMITHDLKSPINAEIAALKIILQDTNFKDDTKSEMLNSILSAAKYTKHLIDNILYKYQYENGTFLINPQKASLNNIIRECIEETKYITNERNQSINYVCNAKDSITYFDSLEIKRVINNLISNSSEYGRINSVININLNSNCNYLIFSIENYGLGIDLENPNQIFDKFVSYAKKHKKIGTGLGLYISKQIINAHNGEIFVESKVNEYTKITFTLPKTQNNQ